MRGALPAIACAACSTTFTMQRPLSESQIASIDSYITHNDAVVSYVRKFISVGRIDVGPAASRGGFVLF